MANFYHQRGLLKPAVFTADLRPNTFLIQSLHTIWKLDISSLNPPKFNFLYRWFTRLKWIIATGFPRYYLVWAHYSLWTKTNNVFFGFCGFWFYIL